MVIFNSYVSHYQRVLSEKFGENFHSIYMYPHISTSNRNFQGIDIIDTPT